MIFLGDIATPDKSSSENLQRVIMENSKIFAGKRIICNLEGLIYDGPVTEANEPLLFNHPSVLSIFGQDRKHVFCMANNHVLDMPGQYEATRKMITEGGFLYGGAGKSQETSEKPIIFTEGLKTYATFNCCWDFLLYNHDNPRSGIYVAELLEEKLIEQVKTLKHSSPEITILVYIHWSLDLERLPFPMYRQFSRALIDAGVTVVAGTHSHCVQGGEKYKEGYIIYGLGNFFIPDNVYAGGILRFPEFSKLTLAFELNEVTNSAVCHWFEYRNPESQGSLRYIGSEDFERSKILLEHSPFREMNEMEYVRYYRSNRRKKILIPVYRDYKQKKLNALYTKILKTRAKLAHLMARLHIIKWQN